MMDIISWVSQTITLVAFMVVVGFRFIETNIKWRYRVLQRDLVIHSLQWPDQDEAREQMVVTHKLLKRDFNYIKAFRIALVYLGSVSLAVALGTSYYTS